MQVEGITRGAAQAHTPGTIASRPPATPFSEALSAAQMSVIHTVQRGETLSHIIKTHLSESGRTVSRAGLYEAVQQVAVANGLSNPNLIHPGQSLDLAVLTPAPPAPAAPAATAQEPASPAEIKPEREFMPPMKIAVTAPLAALAGTPGTAGNAPRADSGANTDFSAMRSQYFSRRSAWTSYPAASAMGGPTHGRDEPTWFELTAQVSLIDPLMAGALPRRHTAATTPATADVPKSANPWAPVLDVPGRITSAFGKRSDPFTGAPDFHDGVDIAAEFGARIRPVSEGVVSFSGWLPGYGKVVTVRHDDGVETVYGHNAANLVRAGERVTTESVLGLLGSTGRSTGPHLHFEVRKNGKAVDPMMYLQPEQVASR